jgi:16S rRNA (cytosine1402-N4)-methyltransferase
VITIPYDMTGTHIPVLAGELVEITDPRPGETVVDMTFGAGGHARLFADRIGPSGTLIAIDRDPAARPRFDAFAAESACRTRFIGASFAEALEQLAADGVGANVIYADLGISSMQVDTYERGFSYSYDAPLDMRMDPGQELDASRIVATWDATALAAILREYADERFAGPIARAIVAARDSAPITTTGELVQVVSDAVPARARFAGGHPAKRTFQALRIAVNDELAQIDAALPLAWDLLEPGGRLAGISFHSGEDRRIKRFMVQRAEGCTCPPRLPVCVCGNTPEAELLTRRAIAPTAGEIASNPRSASARLRAARKFDQENT